MYKILSYSLSMLSLIYTGIYSDNERKLSTTFFKTNSTNTLHKPAYKIFVGFLLHSRIICAVG